MTKRISVDVVIVGAGPAGLAAAVAARRSGASVLVVDGFSQAGGQYFMQPLVSDSSNAQIKAGEQAITDAEAAGITLLPGFEIFAAYSGFQLLGAGRGKALVVEARAVIAANGAHDRVMAFPGWTLPGVMTAGAGQRLAKINDVLPGKRLVIAGSGVFLWAVAQTLLDKGSEIEALVEARRPQLALAAHLVAFPERWQETSKLFHSVSRRVKRVVFGRVVSEAFGSERVEKIVLATPQGKSAETLAGFDALLVGHGFQPNIEITSLLDCEHRFDEALGGWYAAVNDDGRTTVEGLYAAGEVTGVAGYRPAALSGELAGYSAASDLGFASPIDNDAMDRIRRRLARARRFGRGLGKLFAPLPELEKLSRTDTILCRCEGITKGEILEASRDGSDSIHAAKMWTRAGMGRCQGRMCRMSVTACLSQATGRPPELLGFNRPRVPCRPVTLEEALLAVKSIESSVEKSIRV